MALCKHYFRQTVRTFVYKYVLKNKKITHENKMKVYKDEITPTVIYGAKTMCMTGRKEEVEIYKHL